MSTTTESKFKILYVVNVIVSLILAIVLMPFYINLFNKQFTFLETDIGKILKLVLVVFVFVTSIGLIMPTFAAYDETEKELSSFLKSKGVVGMPSFRSV